jgi:hypothetical protein
MLYQEKSGNPGALPSVRRLGVFERKEADMSLRAWAGGCVKGENAFFESQD